MQSRENEESRKHSAQRTKGTAKDKAQATEDRTRRAATDTRDRDRRGDSCYGECEEPTRLAGRHHGQRVSHSTLPPSSLAWWYWLFSPSRLLLRPGRRRPPPVRPMRKWHGTVTGIGSPLRTAKEFADTQVPQWRPPRIHRRQTHVTEQYKQLRSSGIAP